MSLLRRELLLFCDMKTDNPRDLALETLNGLVRVPQYSGNYLDELFQLNPQLDERDRAFISTLVQGVLRWRQRLDWIIGQFSDLPLKKIEISVLNILRIAIYQIFFLDRVPESAAVNEAVNQTKLNKSPRYVTSFVNGLLRNICRHKGMIKFPDRNREPVEYLSVFYSYPRWLTKKWIRELGREFTEDLLSAQNNLPCLNIRTNTLRVSRSKLIEYLEAEGVTGKPSPYAPEGILLEGFRGRVAELKAFKEGFFQVQDQAAMIASHLISPKIGDTLLDICAGFGGKSTHMAELVGGQGHVLALDINRRRLINLVHNTQRLGIGNIQPVVADASKSLSSMFNFKFDKVMVDAPCSGLGVISRHPDSKWNRDEQDIRRLSYLQKTIMNETASLVKKGGRIIFVACTISREENEEVVKDFLDRNRDMSLGNMKECAPDYCLELIDDQGFLKTFPHIHSMDGFFAALFRKH
ncbi:16S rRNA (cytosine(967)-C(5))-methyltransferase RsmB [Deltaproteobacteria bacterium]|nr:16S rRNA (cytosine(967)-C(5))-methyltransferase RsmB [Deltaproteobacteria bacterium]